MSLCGIVTTSVSAASTGLWYDSETWHRRSNATTGRTPPVRCPDAISGSRPWLAIDTLEKATTRALISSESRSSSSPSRS